MSCGDYKRGNKTSRFRFRERRDRFSHSVSRFVFIASECWCEWVLGCLGGSSVCVRLLVSFASYSSRRTFIALSWACFDSFGKRQTNIVVFFFLIVRNYYVRLSLCCIFFQVWIFFQEFMENYYRRTTRLKAFLQLFISLVFWYFVYPCFF